MNFQKVAKILVVLFVFLSTYFVLHRRSSDSCRSPLEPKLSGSIKFVSNRAPLETAVFNLKGENYFFVTYMKSADQKDSALPVYIYPFSQDQKISDNPQTLSLAEHIRSMKKIITPWGEGVLMADHGRDGADFPGGNLHLIVKDKITSRLIDKSTELPGERNFSFNALAVRRSNNQFDDILVTPFNGPKSKVLYFKAGERGFADASETLPTEWRKFDVCFMTGETFDLDSDGKDEIVLGACDLNSNQNPVERDRILEWSGKWKFSDQLLPLRKKEATWGTVYWLKKDNHLIALTHNKGFTTADVQIFNFDQKKKMFLEEKVSSGKVINQPHYFHKAQFFRDHLIILIRYKEQTFEKPNLQILSRNAQGAWGDSEVCLKTTPGETVLGLDRIKNAEGKEQLLISYYSGRYDLFE